MRCESYGDVGALYTMNGCIFLLGSSFLRKIDIIESSQLSRIGQIMIFTGFAIMGIDKIIDSLKTDGYFTSNPNLVAIGSEVNFP